MAATMGRAVAKIVALFGIAIAVCAAAPVDAQVKPSRSSMSPADATPLGMRVNSFFESVADVVEHVSDNVKKSVLHPRFKHEYKLSSRNESMIVASVAGRHMVNDTQRDGALKVWKKGIRHGHVIITVDEADEKAPSNASDKGVRRVEHWFKLGKKESVLMESIDVHQLNSSEGGYEMLIPLYRKSAGKHVEKNVTTQMRRSGQHWGTEREEDEYEFLQAQMECERQHQQSGIRRMMCACERTHEQDAEHAYRCHVRVLERVMKTARTMGKLQVAVKMYVSKARCSSRRDSLSRGRCIQQALEETAVMEEHFRRSKGRRLLSSELERALRAPETR